MSVVLITGCSTGIGRELARVCAEAGDRVFATMRKPSMAGDLEELDGVTILPLDVTSDESVSKCVDEVLRSEGRIDVVVNNAGSDNPGAMEDVPFDGLRATMETNFFGPIRVCRAVLPTMRAQKSGTIVMVSSLGSIFTGYGSGSYSASKRALEAAAEAIQIEGARWGIRVQVARPGYVQTPIGVTSLNNVVSPECSPYREVVYQFAKREETSCAAGEPAIDIAREIRDAYTGGSDDFYVPVTKMARQVMPWRKGQDDRKILDSVDPEFEWWVKGEDAPTEK